MYQQFLSGQVAEQFDRVFVEPSACPKEDMLSVAKSIQDFTKYSSIEMTDIHGNQLELDTMMKHVIVKIVAGQFAFADLPSNYKTYTIFVGADAHTTSADVDALAELRWVNRIMVFFKQPPCEGFQSRFDELVGMGKLRNVDLSVL